MRCRLQGYQAGLQCRGARWCNAGGPQRRTDAQPQAGQRLSDDGGSGGGGQAAGPTAGQLRASNCITAAAHDDAAAAATAHACTPVLPPCAGTIGHVAHGKSTVVKAISGVQTVRFKNELERNITIKLGYANAKIYKCADPRCPRPACYKAYSSSKEDAPKCDVPGDRPA